MKELEVVAIAAAIALIPVITQYIIYVIQHRMLKENTIVTKEVKSLVNSQHGIVLNQLADALTSVSRATGEPEDRARAASARLAAEQHAAANEANEILEAKELGK